MAAAGYLGLGRMGSAIAGRMVDSGIDLTVWNRSPSAAQDDLVAAGAGVAETAAHALAKPVSFSMLADDSAADAVLSRENIGAANGPRVHANMASVSAQMSALLSRRFADAGVVYVAAPVLGRPEVAAAGKLNILLAGPSGAVDIVESYLAPCSVKRWRLGDEPQQANAVKISINLMILHALASMSEGIALVEAEGVPASEFVELFTSTFFGGVVHSVYGGIIAERRYAPPGFTVGLGLKDLSLAERLARESQTELPLAPAIRERFEAALADPQLAHLDWSAIAELGRPSGRPN
ncbi:NAD(P)-dependent oxidoreductase [Arthrobacter sp. MI7-26]|uniref:NAD(P)-dependent oxidoreductase n=1 Tax=Arthrobacter sp. MI7-26 TaxID=2993653 RepID=UPI0022493B99|nr:NAD(P)-dependent oxidoreductase [Arthrobacter sp. MI7-26]MCX2749897.1 NAD(P)-dependent oxidoreductase [Arthrobacter sp. MI7-26]